MTRLCPTCKRIYEDARCSTLCPHDPFLTEQEAARKDLALKLMIAGEVRWADAPEGEVLRIQSVAFDGMVTVSGYSGEFSPHLFKSCKVV